MNGNFSFVEYSHPANLRDTVNTQLSSLGFAKRTKHKSQPISLWSQNSCIILTRESGEGPGITGFGYVEPAENITKLPVQFDTSIDMFALKTKDGFNHYYVSESEIEYTGSLGFNFELADAKEYPDSGTAYFSGFISSHAFAEDYYDLGFVDGKHVSGYKSLITQNKRFHLLFRPDTNAENERQCLVAETSDIFRSTAFLTGRGFTTQNFNVDYDAMDFTSEYRYKIAAYNLMAYGTDDKYTIENFFVEPLPGVDLIIRQRKKSLSMSGKTFTTYYE